MQATNSPRRHRQGAIGVLGNAEIFLQSLDPNPRLALAPALDRLQRLGKRGTAVDQADFPVRRALRGDRGEQFLEKFRRRIFHREQKTDRRRILPERGEAALFRQSTLVRLMFLPPGDITIDRLGGLGRGRFFLRRRRRINRFAAAEAEIGGNALEFEGDPRGQGLFRFRPTRRTKTFAAFAAGAFGGGQNLLLLAQLFLELIDLLFARFAFRNPVAQLLVLPVHHQLRFGAVASEFFETLPQFLHLAALLVHDLLRRPAILEEGIEPDLARRERRQIALALFALRLRGDAGGGEGVELLRRAERESAAHSKRQRPGRSRRRTPCPVARRAIRARRLPARSGRFRSIP